MSHYIHRKTVKHDLYNLIEQYNLTGEQLAKYICDCFDSSTCQELIDHINAENGVDEDEDENDDERVRYCAGCDAYYEDELYFEPWEDCPWCAKREEDEEKEEDATELRQHFCVHCDTEVLIESSDEDNLTVCPRCHK